MTFPRGRAGLVLALTAAAGLLVAGCGPTDTKGGEAKGKGGQAHSDSDAQVAEKAKGHDHSGWWCDEHGVPEEVCGQCNAKVAAEYKKKGDWCKEHDRPDSQCFLCHPELKEKFAAQYRAKYGKEPPPTEDDEKKGEPKKGEN
jgi:cobalt-zinc-cadmium efflux system membrane fusion protein